MLEMKQCLLFVHSWRLYVGNQQSSSPTFSYRRPVLNEIWTNITDLKAEGGDYVTLKGNGFGPVDHNDITVVQYRRFVLYCCDLG